MPRPTSAALHRARREEENRLRDQVLAIADSILNHCEQALSKAALAVYVGRDPGIGIEEGQREIRSARALLRSFFDQIG